MRAEISYDLAMNDDMEFIEGTFRLPGGDWQVVIASRHDIAEPQAAVMQWKSVSGVLVKFPAKERLNAAVLENVLSEALGVRTWTRVEGPDSMGLR